MNIVSLSVFPFGQDDLCEFLLERSKSVFWLKVKIRLGCKGGEKLFQILTLSGIQQGKNTRC